MPSYMVPGQAPRGAFEVIHVTRGHITKTSEQDVESALSSACLHLEVTACLGDGMLPDVSIILPVYNAEEFLDEAIF